MSTKRLSTPLEKQFKLDQWDPEGDSYITIRQARQGEHEGREDLFAETSRIWREGDMGEVEVKTRVSFSEVMRTEVFLTLADSNLEDWDGKPIFAFRKAPNGKSYLDMNKEVFKQAWARLEPDLAREIHEKVFELNPQWLRGNA